MVKVKLMEKVNYIYIAFLLLVFVLGNLFIALYLPFIAFLMLYDSFTIPTIITLTVLIFLWWFFTKDLLTESFHDLKDYFRS